MVQSLGVIDISISKLNFKGSSLLWVDLGRLPGAQQAALSLPLLSSTQGENMIKKTIMGQV